VQVRDQAKTAGRSVAARIVSAQEAERARVSRELHDDTGQALTLMLVRLQLIEQRTQDADVKRELAALRDVVGGALDGVRRMARDLSPSVLDHVRLDVALARLAEQTRAEAGLDVAFAADRMEAEVPFAVARALFRVAQEAITNVVRHAGATRVSVTLAQAGGELWLDVIDDGHGFDVGAARADPSASIGLFGMYERIALVGGTLDIRSSAGGTWIEARVPRHGTTG
jgi:signal transduction histidine kinase